MIQSIQTNYRECDLHHAIQLGGILKEKFQSEDGAYYFTENEHESLFDRQMIAEDNAIPSRCINNCLRSNVLSNLVNILNLLVENNLIQEAWKQLVGFIDFEYFQSLDDVYG